VRATLLGIIAAVPGLAYRRPNDLAVCLGLDAKLAWNVGRCVESSDHFAAALHIPGPKGMRTFLRAARRRGAPSTALRAADDAFQSFCTLVREHAGARKRFNGLVASFVSTNRGRAEIEHRRLLFEGSTYIWGVLARTVFRTIITHPSADAATWDGAILQGVIDFRRTRPGVQWRMHPAVSVDRRHHIHVEACGRPLDERVGDHEIPLLRDFCTRPIPRFRHVKGAFGRPEYEFTEDAVGETGRRDCVIGEYVPQIEPRYRTELYDDFSATLRLRTPAEVAVLDLLVHRDLFDDAAPVSIELYSDLFGGGPAVHYESSDRLPLHEQIEYLGSSLDAGASTDIPQYTEMLQFAVRRLGWAEDTFALHRLRMQYPPIGTTLMLRRALPAAPGG
jgi:hypothetical protein